MALDNVLNTISRGTVLEGKIVTKGDIRIEGRVIGTVVCDAKLVIGEHGVVEGNIEARNAHIAGEVRGSVVVKELLQLQEKSRIEGDISTLRLSVQVGAIFTGNCKMRKEGPAGGNDSLVAENTLRGPQKSTSNGSQEQSAMKPGIHHGS